MPSRFRPPRARLLTSFVVIRRTVSKSTRDGPVDTYVNTVRRAYVGGGLVTPDIRQGLAGSSSPFRVELGPPNPLVDRGDLIAVLPKLLADPDEPDDGDTWVNETTGTVNRYVDGEVEVIGVVPFDTSDTLAITGPEIDDIVVPLGNVLAADGPAVDLGDQQVGYVIESNRQT